jgi:hypothetical protein
VKTAAFLYICRARAMVPDLSIRALLEIAGKGFPHNFSGPHPWQVYGVKITPCSDQSFASPPAKWGSGCFWPAAATGNQAKLKALSRGYEAALSLSSSNLFTPRQVHIESDGKSIASSGSRHCVDALLQYHNILIEYMAPLAPHGGGGLWPSSCLSLLKLSLRLKGEERMKAHADHHPQCHTYKPQPRPLRGRACDENDFFRSRILGIFRPPSSRHCFVFNKDYRIKENHLEKLHF